MPIRTSHLSLIPATAALVALEIRDSQVLGQALQAVVPPNWPPELLVDALPWFLQQLTSDPTQENWLGWYGLCHTVDDALPTLAASGGFFGPPQHDTVEIGYSVLPQFQGRGYATEMMGALVAWAFAQPNVRRAVAETLLDNTASQRVLTKLGFSPIGLGRDAGHLRFERLTAVTPSDGSSPQTP